MIKFGTDGWRAIIAEDFTFENVKKVTQAYAQYLKSCKTTDLKAVVGYDTRFLSADFAKTAAAVLAANDIKVLMFTEPLPSPSLCLAIIEKSASGGIMITASHNPFNFNGIKIKTAKGAPASPDQTKKIESNVGRFKTKHIGYEQAVKSGLIAEIEYRRAYLKRLKDYVNFDLIKQKKFKVLHDSMYGAGGRLIEELFQTTKLSIDTARSEINPSFCGINPEPIPKNLKLTVDIMKNKKYDLALVTDGDGDRIGAVMPGGRFLSPGWIMALLLLHMVKNRKQSGSVVKTISNSSLISKIAQRYNLNLHETPVGFKHIAKIMQREDILIGGEESGGIGFKGYIPERDGILSGLLLLEMMAYENKSITKIIEDVEKDFGKYCYKRTDIHYPNEYKQKLFQELRKNKIQSISGIRVARHDHSDGTRIMLQDGSWLIFRLSGTEPILRIYSESSSERRVNNLLNFGQNFALRIK